MPIFSSLEAGVRNGWIGRMPLLCTPSSRSPSISLTYSGGASNGSCGSNESTPRKNGCLSFSSSSAAIPLRMTRAAE